MIKRSFLLLFLAGMLHSALVSAPHSDTLLVRNTRKDAMANAIMGDTLANGGRVDNNRVYVLTRGERYINTRPIIANGYHLRITGQPMSAAGKDPGPAVVQLAPDSLRLLHGDRVTDRIIVSGGDLTLSNVWVLSWIASGAQLWEPITEEKDSTRVNIDHCIFEWQEGPALHLSGRWTSVFLTNNLFRNAIYKDEWWAGRVVYFTSPADTLVEINNTLENVGFGLIQSQGIGLNYYFCDHNTVVNCAKFCWLESYYRNAYIANNLLVNSHFTGERMKDRKYQDPGTLLYGQTINIDTLKTPGRRITPEEAIRVYGSDAVQFSDQTTLSPTDPQELGRIIVYANNATYFDTASFYGFYRKYNASVSRDAEEIFPEPVMNARTQSMWSWHPHFVQRASVDGENPHFTLMPDNLSSILAFLEDMYSVSPKNSVFWGYDPDNSKDPAAAKNTTGVYRNSSRGTYPSKEDFSYSNSVLLKSGLNAFPVGDLNWFPDRLKSWSVEEDAALMTASVKQPGKLQGAWTMQSQKIDGKEIRLQGRGIKILTASQFVWVQEDKRLLEELLARHTSHDSVVAYHDVCGAGEYKLDGDTYTETTEYFYDPQNIGTSIDWKIRLEGDLWYTTGHYVHYKDGKKDEDLLLEEVWKKLE